MTNERIRLELIAIADADHTQYPQYRNHWDEFVLVQLKRNVSTKGGPAFIKGELALGKRRTDSGIAGLSTPPEVVVYSVIKKIDVVLGLKDVVFL